MIERVISGGQTGADQAGWRAARRFGIPTGGWMPKGFKTEDGPRPEFAGEYGARQHASPDYPPRTRENVRGSDLTIIFDVCRGNTMADLSRGSQLALTAAIQAGVPSIVVGADVGTPLDPNRAAAMAKRIRAMGYKTINVAGNRESKSPGIGAWTEAYMAEVFRCLGHSETP